MTMTYKPRICLCLLFMCSILITTHIPAQALDVKRSELSNGLTLLVVEKHNVPVVKVSMGIKAGSLHEPPEKSGLANLTARLLREGTQNRSSFLISQEIDFVGGSLGVSGGTDYSTASLSILKKDLHKGFELLSDIMLNPAFPEEELKKQKISIKGSLKSMEDDPGYLASREFKSAVFGSHPYGRNLSGSMESIDNITREDLLQFHADYYVPNNTIMAVVGDITTREVEELLDRYFSAWNKKEVSVPSLPDIPEKKTGQTITLQKNLTQATIILGHVGVERSHPDYYKLSVMNYILGGGGFASRLMQNIREDKGLVYDIHSYFSPKKYGGAFRVGLKTKNESANHAISEIMREIEKIRNQIISDAELADAQSFLTGSFPMRLETSSRIAGFLVAVEYYGLGIGYIDDYPGFINSVTKEDILYAARKYIEPKNFILVVVGDQNEAALNDSYTE